MDRDQLAPGQSWREAVDAALATASSCVVVVSKASCEPGGFAWTEWSFIQDAAWRRPDLKVVPVVLGSVELPTFLRAWQSVGPIPPSNPEVAVDHIMPAIYATAAGRKNVGRHELDRTRRRFDEIRESLEQMRKAH